MTLDGNRHLLNDETWRRPQWVLALPLLIVVAGLAAYYNSLGGVFLFDDRFHILGDRRLESLWPLTEALGRRRPVVDYSLAINHALGGDAVRGYHLVNIAIHVLASLALFGIVRRTFLIEPLRARFAGRAPWLALAVAMAWVVHPLQTESVTYVIQRAESLMGLFYLVTLYCAIRGFGSSGFAATTWYGAAVASCALGMGSKAVMITAPLMVLLFDRGFIAGSFEAALRRRWALYMGLAGTWAVLWITGVLGGVLDASPRNVRVGFGFKGVTPAEYLLTQFGVVIEYLKLSWWPYPLCLDYRWPVARTLVEIVPPMLAVLTLVGVTLVLLRRRPWLGFLGAWFFLILAPTSSVVPIRDALFEHRMYLPLAAVLVVIVVTVDAVLRWVCARLALGSAAYRLTSAGLVVLCVVPLVLGTQLRNEVYHSESAMWRDVLAKRPGNSRAAENLGNVLLAEAKPSDALKALRNAVRVTPTSANLHNALGLALVARRRVDEAVESFREAVRLNPVHPRARANLGNALADTGHLDEAIPHFVTALRINPKHSDARLSLGNAYLNQRRVADAIDQYRELVRLAPSHSSGWGNLGTALLNQGELDEAIEAFEKALRLAPDAHNVLNSLGIAFVSQRKLNEAVETFRRALWLEERYTRHVALKDFASIHYNLANCLSDLDNVEGAVGQYRAALAIRPEDVATHYQLAVALLKQGNVDQAIREFRQTLRLKPDHAAAQRALDKVLSAKGQAAAESPAPGG